MIQEARETAQSLKDDIALLDVLLAITQAQAGAGLVDEARKTAQSIMKDSYRAEALASIGEAEATAGRAPRLARTPRAEGEAMILGKEQSPDRRARAARRLPEGAQE